MQAFDNAFSLLVSHLNMNIQFSKVVGLAECLEVFGVNMLREEFDRGECHI